MDLHQTRLRDAGTTKRWTTKICVKLARYPLSSPDLFVVHLFVVPSNSRGKPSLLDRANPAGSTGGLLGSLLDRAIHPSHRSSRQGDLKPAATETEATRVLIRPRLTLHLLEPRHLGRNDDSKFGVAPNVKLRRTSRRHLPRKAKENQSAGGASQMVSRELLSGWGERGTDMMVPKKKGD